MTRWHLADCRPCALGAYHLDGWRFAWRRRRPERLYLSISRLTETTRIHISDYGVYQQDLGPSPTSRHQVERFVIDGQSCPMGASRCRTTNNSLRRAVPALLAREEKHDRKSARQAEGHSLLLLEIHGAARWSSFIEYGRSSSGCSRRYTRSLCFFSLPRSPSALALGANFRSEGLADSTRRYTQAHVFFTALKEIARSFASSSSVPPCSAAESKRCSLRERPIWGWR